jgi:hypothetical protein
MTSLSHLEESNIRTDKLFEGFGVGGLKYPLSAVIPASNFRLESNRLLTTPIPWSEVIVCLSHWGSGRPFENHESTSSLPLCRSSPLHLVSKDFALQSVAIEKSSCRQWFLAGRSEFSRCTISAGYPSSLHLKSTNSLFAVYPNDW